MEQKYIDGYYYTRRHDFEVDANNVKNYNLNHIHLYVWVIEQTPPTFTFITADCIERGINKPYSSMLIDIDNELHIKHHDGKWFRPQSRNDASLHGSVKKAY